MGLPTKPTLDYSYTAFQQSQGDNAFPGTEIDNDHANLKLSIDETIDFLTGSFRSDGVLKASAYPGASDLNAYVGTATAAAVSATASEVAAVAALDAFTDLYLGAKSSDPTLDNDGNALQDGATYWNTSAKVLRIYDLGTVTWANGAQASGITTDTFVGDGSQVAFTLSVSPTAIGNTQVYVGGVYQEKAEYSVAGATLTFNVAPPNGVGVQVMTFEQLLINVPADGSVTPAKIQTPTAGSAAAYLGKLYVMPPGVEAVINVPGDVSTVQGAMDGIVPWVRMAGASVKIVVTGHLSASTVLTCTRDDGLPVTVCGAAPVTLTYTGISGVTGSRGDWSVTYSFSTTTGANIGDILTLTGTSVSFPSQGVTAGPVRGGFQYGISTAGMINTHITASAGSTTTTFDSNVSAYITSGDALIYMGQVREVDVVGATTLTVKQAWAHGSATATTYWQHLKPEAGTVTIVGGVITGSGTSFLSRMAAGDMFVPLDGTNQVLRVQSVTNNTSAALERGVNVAAGTKFCVANAWWQHEGAFEITGKTGTTLTVKNTSFSEYAPPTQGISSAVAKVVPTTLTGTVNGVVARGAIRFHDIFLLGGTAGIGCDTTTGSFGSLAPRVVFTSTAGTIGFNTGVKAFDGAHLQADGAFFCRAAFAGVSIDRGFASLDTSYCHGNGLYGVLHGSGDLRISRARLNCNGENGMRTDAGGFYYADWPTACGNGGRGLQIINASGGQFVGGLCAFNGGLTTAGGLDWQNGGMGRISGSMFLCNYGPGINVSGRGGGEASEVLVAGNVNSGGGIATSGACGLDVVRGGVICNVGPGVLSDKASTINLSESYVNNNTARGVYANNASRVNARSVTSLGNSTSDFAAYGGSYIYCHGYGGVPSFETTLNKILGAGSLIANDTQTVMGP